MWSEINPRVNYPIKAILVEMIENADINIDNSLHLFCVSWFAIKVASVGVELFRRAWNHHPIPGKLQCTIGSPYLCHCVPLQCTYIEGLYCPTYDLFMYSILWLAFECVFDVLWHCGHGLGVAMGRGNSP